MTGKVGRRRGRSRRLPEAPRHRRRTVFGRDPAAYDRARLRYPSRVFELLQRRCGLRRGAATFEIGPGTGIATRELIRRGAAPLVVVEADPRLARYLTRVLRPVAPALGIVASPFEHAVLPPAAFDLGVAASSFHWLPPRRSLRRIARALRPGGWWAAWNNHHGDPTRPSRFHDLLDRVYRDVAIPGAAGRHTPEAHARHVKAQVEQLRATGAFDRIACEDLHWTARLPADRVVALWATFSEIAVLPAPRRARFRTALRATIDDELGGRVTIPMLTPLYTARRR